MELIIALQLEDLESLISRRKGKSVEGSSSDNQVAMEHQKMELQNQLRVLADIRMARSLSCAAQDDGVIIAVLTAEERRAGEDREIARRMSGIPHGQLSIPLSPNIPLSLTFLEDQEPEPENEE